MINNFISSIILLILDLAWIYLYMGNKYNKEIKKIQKNNLEIRKIYALFAYILMIFGLNLFVIPKIRPENRLEDSLKYGFSFGLITYGIYDFTCAAIFKDWNIKLAIIDILWGGFVFFISAYIGSFFIKKEKFYQKGSGKTKLSNEKYNIFGQKLEKCETSEVEPSKSSSMNDFTCSENGGGVHQICVKKIGRGKIFSRETGQGDWSQSRNDKNHCACLGAYANYVAKGNIDKNLKCSAIPETVFDKKYISKWNNWNDVTIPNQIKNGINSLYNVCKKQAKNIKEKNHLDKLYNNYKKYLN